MLSRIAESLFWIGRYVERADGTARIVDALRLQLLEDPTTDENASAGFVLGAVMGFAVTGPVGMEDIGTHMVFDRNTTSSITGSLMAARENARRARETLSTELWESLNTTWHRWNGFGRHSVTERRLSEVRERAALVHGVADSTMSHDDAWHFLALGRALERADMTARLVATGGMPHGGPTWTAVLSSCGAQQAFMRSHRGLFTDAKAAAFLALDRLFPRSVLYALTNAERRLLSISPDVERVGMSDEARRQLGAARATLDFSDTDDILARLPAHMHAVQRAVAATSQAVAAQYFQSGPMPIWTEELV